MESQNIIIGFGIIILNIIPFLIKKPKLLIITSIITVLLLYLLNIYN